MAKAYLPFYFDWREPIALLSDAECGRLLKSLLAYGETGATEELSGNEKFLFALMKQQIDRDAEAYARKCQQNKINRSASYEQERPSTTVNDRQRPSTTVNDRDQEEEKEEEEKEKEKLKEEIHKEEKTPAVTGGGIPYEKILGLYNEICVSYPHCRALSDARKKAIRARINSGYTVEDFRQLFLKAEKSEFLRGKNTRNWQANFDWLLKDANMAKVLDGNYDAKTSSREAEYMPVQTQTPTGDDVERMRRLMAKMEGDSGNA